jgi:hypothetical protein
MLRGSALIVARRFICTRTVNITKDSTGMKFGYEKSYPTYDVALHHLIVSDDSMCSIIRLWRQNLFQFNG